MQAPHSKDIYNLCYPIMDDRDLQECLKHIEIRKLSPKYILIAKQSISARRYEDIGYGNNYILLYNIKNKEFVAFHFYDKNPFEWGIESLGRLNETVSDARFKLHENMIADYEDSLRRNKKVIRPKSKRKVCSCKKK